MGPLPAPRFMVLLACALGLPFCTQKESKPEDLTTYQIRGEVLSIDSTRQRLLIAHEEIPGFMSAMTMLFKVKDTSLVIGVGPSDLIHATLVLSRTESWLEDVTITEKGDGEMSSLTAGSRQLRLFELGERLPEVSLSNQDGRRISIRDFREKTVAITFIYTRCPIPDYCPRMSNNFAAVQKTLTNEPALENKWHLLSISFDPDHDNQTILKSYGKTYNADFSTWDFCSGQMEDVRSLGEGLGLVLESDERNFISHNLRTAVLDSEGRLVRVFRDNDWKPGEVAEEMRKTMAK